MDSGDKLGRLTVTVFPDRCIHTSSKWGECSLCFDSCPGLAIRRAKDKIPQVNALMCLRCGQCLSACPVQAFESEQFDETRLTNLIDSEGPVRLRCFLPYGEIGQLATLRESYQLPTCLAALTPGALFEIALERPCVLMTENCPKCPLHKKTGETLSCNVEDARKLLGEWGLRDNLLDCAHLFFDPDFSPDRGDGDVCTAGSDRLSPLPAGVRSLFAGARNAGSRTRRPLRLKSRGKRVPSWRRRLKALWGEHERSSDGGCLWPSPKVSERRCQACGICMQICPTGSITHFLSDGYFLHTSVPGICVDCGLCIVSCPNDAISRDYLKLDRPFAERVHFREEAKACARCGLPVLSRAESSECALCLAQPNREDFLSRVRRQMTTFLSEYPGERDA